MHLTSSNPTAHPQEVYYRAIAFYLEQHPMLLERLLSLLTPNLDHARVVHQLRRAESLPLVLPYLKCAFVLCVVRRCVDRIDGRTDRWTD